MSESISQDALLRIDSICVEFEAGWESGNPPSIESFLQQERPEFHAALLRDLIRTDLWYRQRQGLTTCEDDYVGRFPDYAPLIRGIFAAASKSTIGHGPIATGVFHPAASRLQDAEFPRKWGKFQLLSVLGEGGMGVVYKAHESTTGRTVGLKVIRPQWLNHAGHNRKQALWRFEQEIKAAAQLEHNHIVRVYEVGEFESTPYYSMQYIEGHNLDEYCQHVPLDNRLIASLIVPVVQAVACAHEHGIIHRDLKPKNILVDANQRPFVTDFGLAKWLKADDGETQPGMIVGTLPYMSPEQASGGASDERLDIYCLGATLYELLTGQPPFMADTSEETIRQVIQDSPIPPSRINRHVAPELEAICLTCLQKSPEKRFSTARELADELSRFLHGEAIRPISSHNVLTRITIATIGTVVLLALCIMLLIPWGHPENAPEATEDSAGEELRPIVQNGAGNSLDPDSLQPSTNQDATDSLQLGEPADLPVFTGLPDAGTWVRYDGTLWHHSLPPEEELGYHVELRVVDQSATDCWIEVESVTQDHRELGIILVSRAEYENKQEFQVERGWVTATVGQRNLVVPFASDNDLLAKLISEEGLSPPKYRLAVRDILSILFRSEVKTSYSVLEKLRPMMAAALVFSGQGTQNKSIKLAGPKGEVICEATKTQVSPAINTLGRQQPQISYELLRSENVPFRWYQASMNLRLRESQFRASLRLTDYGEEAVRELPSDATLKNRWDEIRQKRNLSAPLEYVNLPPDGSWVRYTGALWYAGLKKVEPIHYTVDVRSVGTEMIEHDQYRWIEIEVETQTHHEIGKVLINEQKYREIQKLEIDRGWVLVDNYKSQLLSDHKIANLVVPFAVDEDRLASSMSTLGDEPPHDRLAVRDVLALVFGARIETDDTIKNLRSILARGLIQADREREFRHESITGPKGTPIRCIVVETESMDGPQPEKVPGVNYSIHKSQSIPFDWVKVKIETPPVFFASLKLSGFGQDVKSEMPREPELQATASRIDQLVMQQIRDEELRKIEPRAMTILKFGEVLETKGNRKDAKKWYQKVIDEFPKTKAAAEARQRLKKL